MSRSLFARLAHRFGHAPDAVSRREFLRAGATATAGLALVGLPNLGGPPSKPRGPRVIVVGAGFAGLACAYELMRSGSDVHVVEARSRVGGRVLSFADLVKGKNVEGGGELIGSNHPTWMAYARTFGLRFLDVTEDESLEAPVIFDGRRLSAREAEALYEEMLAATEPLNRDAAAIDEDRPWTSAGAEALDRRSLADWLVSVDVSPLAKRAMQALLAADNGVAAEHQSYLGLLTQIKGGGVEKYWTESEVFRCRGGNQQLARKLAERLGEARITLGAPVAAIDVRDDRATVRCVDGPTFEGDEVVLAVPPSVWRNIMITPELPAVLRPQMGVNVKYLAAVKSRFWKAAGLSPDALTDGAVSETWEATDNQRGDDGAALVAFSGGPAAEACRAFPERERVERYAAEISRAYADFGAQFVTSRFMDWPGDPWTLAGYSFPAPGQVTTVGPLLHAGLGRLHFAGEHACYKFVGYMEGALNSGVSVAKRLAARYEGARASV